MTQDYYTDRDHAERNTNNYRQAKRIRIDKPVEQPEQSVARRSKRAGKLQHFFDFPLDIIYEIMLHLLPLDLLYLSRTVKSLHAMLMRRSAKFIWKQSHANSLTPLPDCPDDISEPGWVALAFETSCSFCDETVSLRTLWSFRQRACKLCLAERFCSFESLDYSTRIGKILPPPLKPLRLQSVLLSSMQPCGTRPRPAALVAIYRMGDVQKLVKTIEALPPGHAVAEFINGRRKYVADVTDHEDICRYWKQTGYARRIEEIHDVRRCRKNRIVDKLTAIGWGEEVKMIASRPYTSRKFFNQAGFKPARVLTDKAWTSMRDDLVKILEENQKQRLAQEARESMPSLSKLTLASAQKVTSCCGIEGWARVLESNIRS